MTCRSICERTPTEKVDDVQDRLAEFSLVRTDEKANEDFEDEPRVA